MRSPYQRKCVMMCDVIIYHIAPRNNAGMMMDEIFVENIDFEKAYTHGDASINVKH